jgi:hypothetical protein
LTIYPLFNDSKRIIYSLFYWSDYVKLRGDGLIIDYSFTKLFNEFITNPQVRIHCYIQNIEVLTDQYEKHFQMFSENDPRTFWLTSFKHVTNEKLQWTILNAYSQSSILIFFIWLMLQDR